MYAEVVENCQEIPNPHNWHRDRKQKSFFITGKETYKIEIHEIHETYIKMIITVSMPVKIDSYCYHKTLKCSIINLKVEI